MNKTTHHCGNCQRELPMSAFYMNKQKQCPDNYCKDCRKMVSRKQRKADDSTQNITVRLPYPVITQIENKELRMSFILHALHVVAESHLRKRKKDQEKEFEDL